jgi:serine/threonine-protein kinase
MATVYRAHDPQLGRDVAIKVMHGAFAGRADLEARFRREARAVAAIKHDGIVDVYDFAPAAAGEPGYIVTEIVEGPTLRSLIDQHGGRLLPEVTALCAARIAGALGAAHARGIVHRDVKPDNVMFDLAGAGPVRVLLTDFGIAHMTEAETMTATGAIVGSPIYMSPEQARGQDILPASDVFSLGVMLYHVTTGRPPFAGRDPLTAIAAILKGEFLRPSQVDAHVGPALEAVIMRCLRSAPGERFPDGHAVETALDEIARDVHALVSAPDTGTMLRRFFSEGAVKFSATVSPRVAEQAHERAQQCLRRREKTRALAEINRAFAYVPDHSGAQALLAAVSRRRRLGRVASAGLALAAVIAAGAGAQHWRGARRAAAGAPVAPTAVAEKSTVAVGGESRAVQPVATTATPAVPRTMPIAVPPSPAQPVVSVSTASKHRQTARPHLEASASPGGAKEKPRPAVAGGSTTVATAAASSTATTAAPPVATTVAGPAHSDGIVAPKETARVPAPVAPASPTTPTPAPVPAARPAPTASLALRASQGFCSPSVDDRPASIHPSYDHLAPGVHRLFCTLPGGAKVFVANYDLHAGTRPNLVIVPGADGRPQLSLPD